MEFKDKLKNLRLEKGMSQQELADKIYVSRSAIAKWENGLGYPSKDLYIALINFFGVGEDYFKTEKAENVIVEKNKYICVLKHILFVFIFAVAIISSFLIFSWFSSVSANDTQRMEKQAEKYLGYNDLSIIKTARKGDYLAALLVDSSNNYCMCVFDENKIFRNRWIAGGGKKSISEGKIASWNYGSPKQEAVLIFCAGKIPENVKYYSFVNGQTEYICSVNDSTVLDIFIIPYTYNINGFPVALDENKNPIQ
ncbi:MAG: helix-turn-helix transcriptional regulator [Clostridia bacterium]|nr:helix-turn-helix transcriptional regulator [Clostridia bacterium]